MWLGACQHGEVEFVQNYQSMAGVIHRVWSSAHGLLVGAARVAGLGATRKGHTRPNCVRISADPHRGGSPPSTTRLGNRKFRDLSITSMATVRRLIKVAWPGASNGAALSSSRRDPAWGSLLLTALWSDVLERQRQRGRYSFRPKLSNTPEYQANHTLAATEGPRRRRIQNKGATTVPWSLFVAKPNTRENRVRGRLWTLFVELPLQTFSNAAQLFQQSLSFERATWGRERRRCPSALFRSISHDNFLGVRM